jgi:hypothetical protein
MTLKQTVLALLGVATIAVSMAPAAQAQDSNVNRRSVLTFSKPVEIPGQVLPAGSYTFQLADTLSDRHVVSISSADGSKQIAMVLGIATYRIESTNDTVVTFKEVPVGSPDAIRTWFFPGRNGGVEFVYPKRRAVELAAAAKVPVPAIAVETPAPDLKVVPLVAITPARKEVPVATVIQTTPRPEQVQASAAPTRLPRTASNLYLLTVAGLLSLWAGLTLFFIRREPQPAPVTSR